MYLGRRTLAGAFETHHYWRRHALFDAIIVLLPLRWITGEILTSFLAIALGFAWVIVNFRFDLTLSRLEAVLLVLFASIFVFAAFNALEYDYRTLYYYLVGVVCVLAGRYVYYNLDRSFAISFIILLGYYAIFAISALTKGIDPAAIDTYFPNSSRNGVSVIAIFLQIYYSALHVSKKGYLPSVTPALTFALSILCYGRTGIIIAGLLFAVSAWHPLTRNKVTVVLAGLAAIVCLLSIVLIPNTIVADFIANTNFYNRGLASIRSDMLAGYLELIDSWTFFAGAEMADVALIREYTLNPHNSFIRGHAYFGFPYLCLVALIVGVGIKGIMEGRWTLTFLLGLFLLRSFYDTVALFDVLDFVLFFLVYLLAKGPPARTLELLVGLARCWPMLLIVPLLVGWSYYWRATSIPIEYTASVELLLPQRPAWILGTEGVVAVFGDDAPQIARTTKDGITALAFTDLSPQVAENQLRRLLDYSRSIKFQRLYEAHYRSLLSDYRTAFPNRRPIEDEMLATLERLYSLPAPHQLRPIRMEKSKRPTYRKLAVFGAVFGALMSFAAVAGALPHVWPRGFRTAAPETGRSQPV